MRKARNGFTLIELLVVIAIIAILAAILFPVFAKAREKARQATCLSNLKQMSLGIIMYKEDYDETYPGAVTIVDHEFPLGDAWAGSAPPRYIWTWQQIIYPYTKNFGVATCPSSPDKSYGHAWYNYGCNDSIMGYPNVAPWAAGYVAINGQSIKTDSQVSTPAEKYLILDYGMYAASWLTIVHPFGSHYLPGGGPFESLVSPWGSIDMPSDYQNSRHNGGVVVGYADGHCKWIKAQVVVDGAITRWKNSGPDPWDPRT